MKKYKRETILLSTCILIVGLVIFSVNITDSVDTKATALYQKVYDACSSYPALNDPFVSTACYYYDGSNEYLLLECGQECITGTRSKDGGTIYVINGQRWMVDKNSTSKITSTETDYVSDIIGAAVTNFLSNEDIMYTYQKPRGSALPLWVYPDDPGYLRVERPGYEDCVEVMVLKEDEKGQQLRWNIAQSPENVTLYLFASDYIFPANVLYVHGWGEISESITEYLTASH